MTESIGWMAAAVLLATMGRQVYTQWRDGTSKGVSKWLFVGQLAASLGFIVYSWRLGNWVFVVTNVLMLLTAALGQRIYLSNRKAAVGPDGKRQPSEAVISGN
jgi:MtN3 and saliva related transmembrane protein